MLVLQGAVCLPLVWSKEGLAVPAFVEKRILRWALGSHWTLEHAQPLRLSLSGIVSMPEARLVHRQNKAVSLGARCLSVDLSWLRLLQGRQPVERLYIEAGSLYGPSTDKQALLDTLYVHASIDAEAIQVDFASVHLPAYASRALFTGRIPQALLAPLRSPEPEPEPELKPLNDRILELFSGLEALQEQAGPGLKGLYLRGAMGETPESLTCYALLPACQLGPVTFTGPVQAQATCSLGRTLCWKAPLIVETQKPIEVLEHQAASGQLSVPLDSLLQPATSQTKKRLHFALKDLQLLKTAWSWGTGSLSLTPTDAHGRVYLANAQGESLFGHFTKEATHTQLEIEGDSDLLHWAQEFFPVDRYLRLPGARRWAIAATLGPDFKPTHAAFRIDATTPWAYNVSMRRAYIEGTLKEKQLTVPYFEVLGMKSQIQGRYEHNFDDHHFRFWIQGGMDPIEIEPWMGAFWPRIFKPFKIRGPKLPRGSLDIAGHWDNPEATTRLWGTVEGEHLEYRGIFASYARATLLVAPDQVSLEDGYIERPEGTSTGRVQWNLTPPFDTLVSSDFEAQGRMFISDLHTWSKNEFLTFLKKLSFSVAPHYQVSGRYEAHKAAAYTLWAQVQTDSPFYYKKLQLDSAEGTLGLRDNQLDLDVTPLGFAGGKGTVVAHVDVSQDSQTPYHLELDMQDITERETVSNSFSDLVVPIKPDPHEKPAGLGRLSIQATLDGDLRQDPILSAQGSGSFSLKDMDLEDVYFLGLLSHIMRILPLPFGRVSLDTAEGAFSLEPKGALYFDELLLKGPAAEVRGQGAYDLSLDSLDVQLKFFLLGGVRAPVFSHLGRLLNPISHMFEVYVTGPLMEPKWSFKR